ncbi:MAG TPA: hypothetical protein GX523_16035 [Desulfitobacterium dehalogenans]|uniref:Tetratricopeptide repeat protein n=1 Tax=Desulfitobacterium dehalogenans TaxID=36854 RepID=A0A7C6Z6J1_9FIRM|nr:hypothetical protein [Desulfitobacterium dehalogenans]
MPLVPAICSQCGAKIEVEDNHEAGICSYCGMAFITEKVINNHLTSIDNMNIQNATINVNGPSMENLILRAEQFKTSRNIEKAKEYYNKALDIDATNVKALEGLKNVEYVGVLAGTTVTFDMIDRIEELLTSNQKIQAIKYVNQSTSIGLRGAKNFVDEYEVSHDFNAASKKVSVTDISKQKKSGCYVATAVYGSYNCPEVWTLRRWRDEKLATTWYGRAFIHMYYAISPAIVRVFGETFWFRKLWKSRLDTLVYELKGIGYQDTPYEDKVWAIPKDTEKPVDGGIK